MPPSSASASSSSRTQGPSERTSKGSSSSGKAAKSAHPSSRKKSSRTPNPSPPKTLLSADLSPERLPPLPSSILSSPARPPARPASDDRVDDRAATTEDPDGASTSSAQDLGRGDAHGAYGEVPLLSSQTEAPSGGPAPPPSPHRPPPPRTPFHTSMAPKPDQLRSSAQAHRQHPGSPQLANSLPLTYGHPQSPTLPHYPLYAAHPAPQPYGSPPPFFPPHQPGPQHYYPYPPSGSIPNTPTLPHRSPYGSGYRHPAYAPYDDPAGFPADPGDMSTPSLERQASAGSRVSASADAPPDGSPRSATSFERPAGPDPDTTSAVGSADDPQDLAQRIQTTIASMANMSAAVPDLHQLLARYQQSRGQQQQGLRDKPSRRTEGQQADLLRQKEQQAETLQKQLEVLQRQLESMTAKHTQETSKLRLEVGNLEEKERGLIEREKELVARETQLFHEITETHKQKIEAEIGKDGVEQQNAKLREENKRVTEAAQKDKDEAKRARENAQKAKAEAQSAKIDAASERDAAERERQEAIAAKDDVAKEKEDMQSEFDGWKQAAHDGHEVEKAAIKDELEGSVKAKEDEIEALRAELTETARKEKDALRAEMEKEKEALESATSTTQKEFEGQFAKERRELQEEKTAIQEELRNERDKLARAREAWEKEQEELVKRWEGERDGVTAEWEGRCKSLADGHAAEKESAQHDKDASQLEMGELRRQLEVAAAESGAAVAAKDQLQRDHDKERSRLEDSIAKTRETVRHLEKEKAKLQKMVETFGEVIDIKSKGDSFYIDAFKLLSKQIVDFSKDFFKKAPSSFPDEVLAKVSPDLPPFLGDTECSRCLRSAYIQHVVSSTLCRRVFDPFLFSLGRRHEKADDLFKTMSEELRNRSRRKETVWRQHTLYAAYTSPAAKKTTNAVAALIVDETMRRIGPLVDPDQLELANAAVRRIVKLAGETWRYARLERELITAKMATPGPTDPSTHSWARHDYAELGEVGPDDGPQRIVLGLLPEIARDAMQGPPDNGGDKVASGCLYTRGVALLSDCAPVRARRQELEAVSERKEQERSSTPPAEVLGEINPEDHSKPLAADGGGAKEEGGEEGEGDSSDDDCKLGKATAGHRAGSNSALDDDDDLDSDDSDDSDDDDDESDSSSVGGQNKP